MLSTSTLLYSQGYASLYEIVPAAYLGALISDHLGFYIGSYSGERFHHTAFALKRQKLIKKTEAAIIKYGAAGIIIGRLVTPIRSFTPLLIGVSGMNRLKFTTFDLVACLIWCAGLAGLIKGLDKLLS